MKGGSLAFLVCLILFMAGSSSIFVLVFSSASADKVNPELFSIDSKPYGLTFIEWSEKWWQWFASIPESQNPGSDTTGQFCSVGQNDSNVWYLTGAGSGNVVRTCTIPHGKAILLNVVGNECSFAENPDYKTESELRECAIRGDRPNLVYASIDGKNLENLQQYIVQTPLFNLSLPEKNFFGTVAGPTKAVAHTYLILIQPLSIGKHEIHFGQSTVDSLNPTNNYSYDVIYHLIIE